MGLERVDVVDAADRVIRAVTRAEMRAGNLLHRNVAVLCLNGQGEIYVQQRTDTKDVFPGLYDAFVGGVVSASEPYDLAAKREIAEELGIVGATPERLFKGLYEDEHTRAFTTVYRVVYDGPIVHQASEVQWGGFRTREQVLANDAGWRFVPDGWHFLQEYCRRYP